MVMPLFVDIWIKVSVLMTAVVDPVETITTGLHKILAKLGHGLIVVIHASLHYIRIRVTMIWVLMRV